MSDAVYFFLSTGGPTELLDTTGKTLKFRRTPVEKHCCTGIYRLPDFGPARFVHVLNNQHCPTLFAAFAALIFPFLVTSTSLTPGRINHHAFWALLRMQIQSIQLWSNFGSLNLVPFYFKQCISVVK